MVEPIDTSKLGPIRALPPKPGDWRAPYRTMDAQGEPDTAGAVGFDWIESLGIRLRNAGRQGLSIETSHLAGDGFTIQLWDGTALLALATVFRDPMNFAVLVRWAAQGVA